MAETMERELLAPTTAMSQPQPMPQPAPKLKHVFIVAVRRSGTTWVTMLMAQHPQVVGLQQSSFFYCLRQFSSYFEPREGVYGRHILTAGEGAAKADAGLDRKAISSVISMDRMHHYVRPLAEEVYRELAASAEGALAVVDQQPENVHSWERILEIFPEAYFLNVTRDPRSVFSSFVQCSKTWSNREAFSRDPIRFGNEWNGDIKLARSIQEKTDRYHELSYERLKRDGVEELGRLHEFLELPTSTEMCQSAIEACTMGKLQDSSHGPKSFFRKGEVDGWRKELSRGDIAIIEHMCFDFMEELSYERHVVQDRQVPFAYKRQQFTNRVRAKLLRIARERLS